MPEKSARHNLRQVLYALRQTFPEVVALGNNGTVPLLLTNRFTVQINPEAMVEVDIHRLDSTLDKTRSHDHLALANCESCIQALKQVVTLHAGEFLSDFYLEDSNPFEDWVEAIREEYRYKVLEILEILADIAIQNQDYEQACHWVQRQLTIDNLRESAHRQMMKALALASRRVEALHQYRQFSQLLREELDIAPSQETSDLYERIRQQSLAPVSVQTEIAVDKPTPPRNNLTPQPTSFVGRQEELAQLDEMLKDPDTRLVTLVGPGGMGKTRLAIACAQQQLESTPAKGCSHPFLDGVFFVPLASIDTVDQIARQIARALNLSVMGSETADQTTSTIDQQLLDFLNRKRILLVLDNFEHILEGAHKITEIIQAAPDVRILLTSRQRLHLYGEQVFLVDGLTYPFSGSLEDLSDYAAIQLFVNRARHMLPDFTLNEKDIIYLIKICSTLGGMPLGLELAASWVSLLSIQEIAAEIQKNIDFLETDWIDLPERHHSLLAVCDTTWKLMKPSEQVVFARLSVFRGGFTRIAAQEVAQASIPDLRRLVSKSMLQYDEQKKRYSIHTYLQQYGADKIKTTPDENHKTQDAHFCYYSAEMEKYGELFESGQIQAAIEFMESDMANLRAAWDWAISHQNIIQIDQMMDGFCHYFDETDRYPEALSFYQSISKMLAEIVSTSIPSAIIDMNRIKRMQAKGISLQGWFCGFQDREKEITLYKQSLRILSELEDIDCDTRKEKAQLLCFQGKIIDDYHSAKSCWLESIALAQEIHDDYRMLYCLNLLARKALEKGLLDEAESWLEQGLSLALDQKNQEFEFDFLTGLGTLDQNLGLYDQATQYFTKILEMAQAHEQYSWMGTAASSLGHLNRILGNLEEAKDLYQKAIKFYVEAGWTRYPFPQTYLGVSQWLLGEFKDAEKSIRLAVETTGDQQYVVHLISFFCKIELLVLLGHYDTAHQTLLKNDTWLKGFDLYYFPYDTARYLRILSWLSLIEKNFFQAIENIEKSISIAKEQKDEISIAWAGAFLALVEHELGNTDIAKGILINALSIAIETQGYIAMVFCLPMTLLILAKENLDLATDVYQQVKSDPFLAKAQLFYDLVFKHLPVEITCISEVEIKSGPQNREALWATAKLVLKKWMEEEQFRLPD